MRWFGRFNVIVLELMKTEYSGWRGIGVVLVGRFG
jgi:hypothetical protein